MARGREPNAITPSGVQKKKKKKKPSRPCSCKILFEKKNCKGETVLFGKKNKHNGFIDPKLEKIVLHEWCWGK